MIISCCPRIIAVSRVTQEASSASDRGSSQEQRTRSRMTICVHTRTEQWSGNSNFIIIIPWAWHPHPRLRRKQICIKPKSHQIIYGFIGTLGLYRARLRKVIEKSIRLIEGPTLTPYTNIFIDSCQSLNIKYNYYTWLLGIETKAKHYICRSGLDHIELVTLHIKTINYYQSIALRGLINVFLSL